VNFRQWTRLAGTPPFRMALTGGGTVSGEDRINRWISDSDHNYFGYDLLFDPTERRAVYRLAFEPLSITPDQYLSAACAHFGIERPGLPQTGEQLRLGQLPPPQVLSLGRALEFHLATADGKYEVIERITFSKPPRIRRLLRSLAILLSGGARCAPDR
jgi:hypothetical protein